MDARSGYLLEKLPKSEVKDFSLEEVPDRSLPARARRHAGRQQSTPGDAGVADSARQETPGGDRGSAGRPETRAVKPRQPDAALGRIRAGAGGGELESLHDGSAGAAPYDRAQWEARLRGSCMSRGSVGMSILSTPCTGSPSRHWTARFEAARPGARGSTRSLISCGRPVSRFRRSNGRGRLSRGAGFTPSRGSR